MLQRMKHKGALFVEYALLFSFVTLSGLILITSDGVSDSVGHIFRKAAATVGFAADEDRRFINFMEAIQQATDAIYDNDENSPTYKQRIGEIPANKAFVEFAGLYLQDGISEYTPPEAMLQMWVDELTKDNPDNANLQESLKNLDKYTFFKNDNGDGTFNYYATWTTENLDGKKENDNVNVMISYLGTGTITNQDDKLDYNGSTAALNYYVGTTQLHKVNGELSYTPSELKVVGNDQIKQTVYTNSTDALIAYYALK